MVFPIEELGLAGLFLNTLLSASIVPFPSEPAIILATSLFDPEIVFLVAVIGSFIGGITSYFIGLKALHSFIVKREPEKERKAQKIFAKYGNAVLLLSPWIPFIGDPMMIVAGALRMDFKKFLVITLIARIIKTAIVVFFSVKLFSGF